MFLYGGLCLLNRSTVSGNNSPSGGGGIRLGGGLLRLIDSTVSGNHTERSGGGIYHTAEPQSADLTVVNSTISGNTAGDAGGGIYSVYEGWIRIVSSTISNNTAGGVGDAFFFERQWLPSTISSSLVDGDCSGDIGDFVSDGYNIESPGDTCGFDQTGDQSGVTAEQLNLGPLQDNGGPTETHALLPGSFAIDQVPLADCVDADGQPLTTDQRGEPRPETGGAMCDVGAFEVQP
jgi:parallel beta-helix repeat protein